MATLAARKNNHRDPKANRAKWELKLGDRLNLSSYVGVDPINFIDPLGLDPEPPPIVVTGSRCPSGWTCYDPGYGFQTVGSGDLIVVTASRRTGGRGSVQRKSAQEAKPRYCQSLIFRLSTASQQFGGHLSNFASGVIAAGLIAKVPHAVAAGELVGAAGLAFQSAGTIGRYGISGNTSLAALETVNIGASFLKTQTKAAQIASGHTFGAAISLAQDVGRMDPCSR